MLLARRLLMGALSKADAWTLRESGTYSRLESIAWSGTQFVAVGETGTILTNQ